MAKKLRFMSKKFPDKIILSYKGLIKEIKRLETLKRGKYDILRGGLAMGKKAALLEICGNHLRKHKPELFEKEAILKENLLINNQPKEDL